MIRKATAFIFFPVLVMCWSPASVALDYSKLIVVDAKTSNGEREYFEKELWFETNTPQEIELLKQIKKELRSSQCFSAYEHSLDKAKLGNSDFQLMVAHAYLCDRTEEGWKETTYYWIREAALSGNPNAQYEMGLSYHKGVFKQDYLKAREWYTSAANHGHAQAAMQLAELYMQGLGGPKDMSAATEYVHQAALAGNAKAQFDYGAYFYNGVYGQPDYATAYTWIKKSAEQGFADAQARMSIFYGTYIAKKAGLKFDIKKTMSWATLAADNGDIRSMVFLGVLYAGYKTPQHDTACSWFEKAAWRYDAHGLYFLGQCLEKGQGRPQNLPMAFSLYTMALEQGYTAEDDRTRAYNAMPQDEQNKAIALSEKNVYDMRTAIEKAKLDRKRRTNLNFEN